MDEIKALNDTTGPSIPATISPSYKIFVPYLMRNKDAIQAISPKTETYGEHPRQKLDVYRPKGDIPPNAPIMAFFHGGGFVTGDKISPKVPEGLVFHNLGTFFASRGIITIIPNYRRVNSETGGEDAEFPSGGEDTSLVMKWLETFASDQKRDVYLMGNSAGGVHISTFLFEPRFLEQRLSYFSGEKSITLKGAIEVAVPCHFRKTTTSRLETLRKYYGNENDVETKCVYGLLEAIIHSKKSREEVGVPKVLALLGQYDPAYEIGEPMEDFVALWKKTWREGLEFAFMEGHNHISPPLALMSGDAKGERWGEDVVKWIQASK
jgi:hypothetical protein